MFIQQFLVKDTNLVRRLIIFQPSYGFVSGNIARHVKSNGVDYAVVSDTAFNIIQSFPYILPQSV